MRWAWGPARRTLNEYSEPFHSEWQLSSPARRTQLAGVTTVRDGTQAVALLPEHWPHACPGDHIPGAGCPLADTGGRGHSDRDVEKTKGPWTLLWDLLPPVPAGVPAPNFTLLKRTVFSANPRRGRFDSGNGWVQYQFLALDSDTQSPWALDARSSCQAQCRH